MINFIKKHKLNIISSLFCAFAMALFTIIFFSCKTYAYTIDNNGNLVGDNLFNINTPYEASSGVNYTIENNQIIIITNNGGSVWDNLRYRISLRSNTTYTFSLIQTENTYIYINEYLTDNTVLPIRGNGQTTTTNLLVTFTTNQNSNFVEFAFYDTLRQTNTISKIMLNEGSSALEWEPYGVWYSSSNYDTLENQLNNTNGLLDLQIDITKYGWLSYIDNLDYYVTGNFVEDFSLNELKSNNYISNNATLDLYQMSLYQNPNYSYIRFDIYFQNSYANTDYFSANLFDISTKIFFNGVLTIVDTDNNSAIFNITDIASVTYEDIISKNSNFGDYIYSVSFEFASPDATTMIYTNSFYSRGYQTGYSYGSNVSTSYYTPIINDLNSRISNLENNIDNLNNTIDTLKELNSQYQEQLANNVGWSSLFFAFADTPFKVVSNVLGFELFGLNLFSTFIGMITVFGVVYLLKKFL